MDATGAVYRVVTDQLGSPLLIVNVADVNDVLLEAEYSAFGERTVLAGDGDALTLGFAGGELDRDTGLTRFGARDYDPTVGRWMSKDPILFLGHDGNLYVYVYNDPVNLHDPDGLRWRGIIAVATSAWNGGKALWKDLSIDGPSPGLSHGNGRVFGIRYKKRNNLFRLDYQPIPGSGGESRLHCHLGNSDAHFPLDPRSFRD